MPMLATQATISDIGYAAHIMFSLPNLYAIYAKGKITMSCLISEIYRLYLPIPIA